MLCRNLEPKAGPGRIGRRLQEQAATQKFRPAFRQGKAQANAAGDDFCILAALKGTKNRTPLEERNSRPAILDLERQPTGSRLAGTQADAPVFGVTAVFASVVDQNAQDLLYQPGIRRQR